MFYLLCFTYWKGHRLESCKVACCRMPQVSGPVNLAPLLSFVHWGPCTFFVFLAGSTWKGMRLLQRLGCQHVQRTAEVQNICFQNFPKGHPFSIRLYLFFCFFMPHPVMSWPTSGCLTLGCSASFPAKTDHGRRSQKESFCGLLRSSIFVSSTIRPSVGAIQGLSEV